METVEKYETTFFPQDSNGAFTGSNLAKGVIFTFADMKPASNIKECAGQFLLFHSGMTVYSEEKKYFTNSIPPLNQANRLFLYYYN